MHRRTSCISTFVLLSIIIQLGLCSTSALQSDVPVEENDSIDADDLSSTLPSITTTTTPVAPVVEDTIDNVTDPPTTTTTTISTTTTINQEQKKQFLTEYFLNVNLSSSLSDVTFNTNLNRSILVVAKEHEILLINKNDGTIQKHFKLAHVIPIHQQSKESSRLLVIFDDNSQELWIFNSNEQRTASIPFKPTQIHILSPNENSWIAETSDQVALYLSQNSGLDWKKINDSSSSVILGWSNKANSLVINQYSRFIKLLEVTTYEMTSILMDVTSTKLFSRYLLAKRSNTGNDMITISHVNNLADEGFRSLPERFQSQGNFYCAVEDSNTEDLLLMFIAEGRLGENNETMPSTCNLIGYSRQDQFNLTNIDCQLKSNESSSETIECSSQVLPFYQVRGLSKRVFLANVASGPTTMVSFDGGATWNRTYYECDKTSTCPHNASLVMNSLISSNEAPGIIVGKASNGINEYVAISFNGGRVWQLSSNVNGDQIAISNPDALIVMAPHEKQPSLGHIYRYSTDYGRHWHEGTLVNETSFQVLSLIADKNNIFYLLTANHESSLNLIEMDFNLLLHEQCTRYQLKEWALPNACINGSKIFYKRRISRAHCLDNASVVRIEPCACSLVDFECSPGYRRSKVGTCLPKSQFVYSQDCTCQNNSTLSTKSRGYVKSASSQCAQGVEAYLSSALVQRRDAHQPNLFVYATDARTKHSIVEIHTNGFDPNEVEEDDDDENLIKNTIWLIDQTYEINGVAFDENTKQIYVAVEHDQSASIYRVGKNLREQDRSSKQLIFDANNELYKSSNERIQYLTMDWLTQNLYVLVQNKETLQQTILLLDIRTHKRRSIIKNQQIQPAILIVDPIKADLYWITHHSPAVFNIGNLQGQIKKQTILPSTNSNITYMSYDPVTHEIIFVVDSNIYGFNTLARHHLSPRLIYEHSSTIKNPLFVHPILYFTNDHNETESTAISLHAIDILAKSFAKNIARFKHLHALKLFMDMTPTVPTITTVNRCANHPCSDICLPLEHGQFRCLCGDDARYQSCSCPSGEKFVAGACQAKNEQCAPGRVLCQNRLNCAESALACEQDHTQYSEAFKNTARCTLDTPNDGFDCYYTGTGIHTSNSTCIPFEWLCDGAYDCPLHNDEDHCHKLTTTKKPAQKTSSRCLTDKKFTHIICQNKCMKIRDVCRNVSNALSCSDQFHLNCKQTHDKDQYVCKCHDQNDRCTAMIEHCDDLEHCEQVCKDSVHYANSNSAKSERPSSTTWIILIVAILVIVLIIVILMIVRCLRLRKQVPATPRVPPGVKGTTVDSPPSDVREKLLNNATSTANGTS